jgi:hypothetical protein
VPHSVILPVEAAPLSVILPVEAALLSAILPEEVVLLSAILPVEAVPLSVILPVEAMPHLDIPLVEAEPHSATLPVEVEVSIVRRLCSHPELHTLNQVAVRTLRINLLTRTLDHCSLFPSMRLKRSMVVQIFHKVTDKR